MKNEKLGYIVCQNVWRLEVEKEMSMKMSKAWASYEIFACDESQQQHLMSLWRTYLTIKKNLCYEAVFKLVEEAQNEMLVKVCLKYLSCEKDITAKVFCAAYKVAKKKIRT